ncbi:MAG: sigma-70 family RNA polymerase sigma factor [Bryobacteraceae bacterium]|nr:sigma-70 family RNA polymerase sigma factor [Bryobacteraceae bacterium]
MAAGDASSEPLNELLQRWQRGDRAAFDEAVPVVYEELRRLARVLLRNERAGHTLGCTALVHEAYLRLCGASGAAGESLQARAHFFGAAARAMRRVLVDHARARKAVKRGEGHTMLELDQVAIGVDPNLDVLALDLALDELNTLDPERARIVELRFFAGLSLEEAAALLDCSEATLKRDWAFARAWLYRRITGEPEK